MENLDPPSPPNQGWEMARFCPSRAFILDLGGWGFAVPFYFVQDCSKNRTSCGHYFTNKLTTLTWHCGEVALAKLGLTKS